MPQSQWGLALVEHLFDHLRDGLRLRSTAYDIVGFSGGGRLFIALSFSSPRLVIAVQVAASPGRYAFPTLSVCFPCVLGGSPIDGAALGRVFARNFILGDRDTSDRTREHEAMVQGKNRLARGLRFFATATEEADALGVPLNWQLRLVSGEGHNPVSMVLAALELLTK